MFYWITFVLLWSGTHLCQYVKYSTIHLWKIEIHIMQQQIHSVSQPRRALRHLRISVHHPLTLQWFNVRPLIWKWCHNIHVISITYLCDRIPHCQNAVMQKNGVANVRLACFCCAKCGKQTHESYGTRKLKRFILQESNILK